MIKLFKIIIIFIVLTSTAYADSTRYLILVDAGSSGSRAHLIQYQASGRLPVLKEIYSVSNKEPLASFADHPEKAGVSLKNLLDQVQVYVNSHGLLSSDIPVSVMATAGMRLLPEAKQNAIYTAARTYLATNTGFPVKSMSTISGKAEALYGWINVNYLMGNFAANRSTVGTLDIGGASIEIAYVTTDESKPADMVKVELNEQTYHVFSKSFLGMGLDQARQMMNTNKNAASCYPQGYTMPGLGVGAFNYLQCRAIYTDLITTHQIKEQLAVIPAQMFVGFSGIYYTFDFFRQPLKPTDNGLQSSINNICYQTWPQLKSNYPSVLEKFLAVDCADATYQELLVFHTYSIANGQLTITNQINQQDIDWTLGAALFELTQSDSYNKVTFIERIPS